MGFSLWKFGAISTAFNLMFFPTYFPHYVFHNSGQCTLRAILYFVLS